MRRRRDPPDHRRSTRSTISTGSPPSRAARMRLSRGTNARPCGSVCSVGAASAPNGQLSGDRDGRGSSAGPPSTATANRSSGPERTVRSRAGRPRGRCTGARSRRPGVSSRPRAARHTRHRRVRGSRPARTRHRHRGRTDPEAAGGTHPARHAGGPGAESCSTRCHPWITATPDPALRTDIAR